MSLESSEPSVTHYKQPTMFRGVFWLASKKTFIYCLVKKYPILHDYVSGHEKKHYRNYYSGKHYIIRILLDVLNEWNGWLRLKTCSALLRDLRNYEIDVSTKNGIIKNPDKLMEILSEKKPTRKMRMYVIIVGELWVLPLLFPFLIAIAFMVDYKYDTLTRRTSVSRINSFSNRNKPT